MEKSRKLRMFQLQIWVMFQWPSWLWEARYRSQIEVRVRWPSLLSRRVPQPSGKWSWTRQSESSCFQASMIGEVNERDYVLPDRKHVGSFFWQVWMVPGSHFMEIEPQQKIYILDAPVVSCYHFRCSLQQLWLLPVFPKTNGILLPSTACVRKGTAFKVHPSIWG